MSLVIEPDTNSINNIMSTVSSSSSSPQNGEIEVEVIINGNQIFNNNELRTPTINTAANLLSQTPSKLLFSANSNMMITPTKYINKNQHQLLLNSDISFTNPNNNLNLNESPLSSIMSSPHSSVSTTMFNNNNNSSNIPIPTNTTTTTTTTTATTTTFTYCTNYEAHYWRLVKIA
jgi:hypothetical protein